MKQQGYAAYRSVNIETSDQGKLILIAYDVAIKHGKLAMDLFGDHHTLEERMKHLFKMQDAISELLSALNLDVGEIAQNLFRLYEYMLKCIVEAGAKNNREKLLEAMGYLESLREAWAEAILKVRAESAPAFENNSVAISG